MFLGSAFKALCLLFLVFFAATAIASTDANVDPNGDATVTNAWLFSSGSTHWNLIDDGTRQPTTPNTADYIYVNFGDDDTGNVALSMTSLTGVSSVSSITVWAYGDMWAGTAGCTGDISKDGTNWVGWQWIPFTVSSPYLLLGKA